MSAWQLLGCDVGGRHFVSDSLAVLNREARLETRCVRLLLSTLKQPRRE